MGVNLFEIDRSIKETLDNCFDKETGEALAGGWGKLEALEVAKSVKCLNTAKYIKGVLAEAKAVKEAEKVLSERRKRLEKKAEKMKDYLTEFANNESYKDSEAVISWRKSEVVEVQESEFIPSEFIKVTKTVNKAEIKKALKAGELLEFAELVQKNNIQIG
jgi:hypothetical protein|tara:strand:- start:175 stop:657 length:483 start_codon:yes stop_codon:yes gene_type:complete